MDDLIEFKTVSVFGNELTLLDEVPNVDNHDIVESNSGVIDGKLKTNSLSVDTGAQISGNVGRISG